jgi:peptidoglycan/LPS O-acetylase OafA/YrhL
VDRIAVVNGLRGLAILGVLFQHIGLPPALAALNAVGLDAAGLGLLAPLAANGWTGVNLFFILSGFVLALPYAQARRSLSAPGAIRHFYRRRFWRLMPLYGLAGAVLLLLAAPRLAPGAFAGLAIDLATLRFVLSPHRFGVAINYPLWSIGVEILFSLAFPALLLLARRIGFARLLGLAAAAALAMRLAGRAWDPHPLGPNFIADNIFGRIDEFVLGMAFARWHAAGRIFPRARHLLAPGIVLVLLAWAGFFQCQYRGLSMLAMAPLNDVLDAGFACLLAAALAPGRGGVPGRGWRRLLSWAPLQVAGMMCYSLYIWHAPVLEAVQPAQGLPAALAVLLVLAAFSYRYVECARAPDWRPLFLWR